MLVVDAHEDIAYNTLNFGRDYTRPVTETRAAERGQPFVREDGAALLGWPEWVRGRVAVIFATLFATPIRMRKYDWERLCYRDPEEAHQLYRQQLDFYHRWAEEHPEKFRLVGDRGALQEVLGTWEGEEPAEPVIGLVPLMEGADAVREPEELEEWYQRGLRIVGPAWTGTRYAGGTREPGPLTAAGWELLDVMAGLGMLLDLSHMAEEATLQALDSYEGVLIASHSNARALLEGSPVPDRHLTDSVIRRIAERSGVIGVVPFNRFLLGGWRPSDGREHVLLDHVVAQIDHMCQLVGEASHVGLGSDFDGGLGLRKIPVGLDSVADLRLIGKALAKRGFDSKQREAVLGGNWLRLLARALPES
jgi:membrane dipeptidase